jgi:hypothetical protein
MGVGNSLDGDASTSACESRVPQNQPKRGVFVYPVATMPQPYIPAYIGTLYHIVEVVQYQGEKASRFIN